MLQKDKNRGSAAMSPTPSTITEQLCARIVSTGWADLTPEALAAARRLVLDGLAVAIAGTREHAIRLLIDHHLEQGGSTDATVLGDGARVGTVAAAVVNGAAMHVLDFEPMWSPANHALSTTLPAVLALAERRDVSGRELVTALVKGIEMQGWIRHASRQWEAGELIFPPPGVVGPLGAAVAAGHLLGLDAGQTANALGIAASRSGGLMANVGTMTKSLHCGQAAGAGLEAALLAKRDFTANPDIFGAPRGLAEAFSPDFVDADLLGFGPPFRVVEPGFAIKLFPCQYGTHFGITAGLSVRAEIADPAAIVAVRLTAPVMAYVDRPRPATGLDGKFSLQYTLAAALLDARVDLATFTDARLARADMQRMLRLVELTMSNSIVGSFEEMHVTVEVDLADGTMLHRRCDGPIGMWGAEPITEAAHAAKVADCVGGVLDAVSTAVLVDAVSGLDDLTNAEVRQLIAATVPEGSDT